MPGFWTHIIAGDLIIDEIENTSLKNMIKSHKKFFNLGCQGPDFLYFTGNNHKSLHLAHVFNG
ncbi:MAG: hypothetical protein ACOC4G_13445, partial [Bacillota bacterium]